jgi:hypothetical protein
MQIDALRRQLSRLNKAIALEMKRPAVDLAQQSGRADADLLFLYGIVGGKDVGKTTIINHLAGAVISPDSDILDEGTRVTVAYCHGEDLAAVKERLGPSIRDQIEFVTHDRRELHNVVLMDLPDYDSRFNAHLAEVNTLTRYLQGLIWVTTPRKYGDHAFLEQLATVAQSHENYFIIVNKTDQVGSETSLATIRDEVYRFISGECEKRSIPLPDPERLFLLAALEPEKYEFRQMHDRLIRPHTTREIARAKITNLRAEFEQNLQHINHAYDLDHHLGLIDNLLNYVQKKIVEEFGEDYARTVCERLSTQQNFHRRVSKAVFAQRVKQWPVLRTVFYPLTVVISALGGRVRFESEADQSGRGVPDLLRHNGKAALNQLFQIRDDMLAAFPDLSASMGSEPDFPNLVEKRLDALLKAYEERLTDNLMLAKVRPGPIKRALIYLPLFWFPFLQPFLLKLNALAWSGTPSLANLKELAVFLVSLLGSGALLTSFAFLGLFYAILLMAMYTQVARAVQKQGHLQFQDLWYEYFLSALAEILMQPIMDQQVSLAAKKSQLEQIENGLHGIVRQLEETPPIHPDTGDVK